jgi:hypothetical protein
MKPVASAVDVGVPSKPSPGGRKQRPTALYDAVPIDLVGINNKWSSRPHVQWSWSSLPAARCSGREAIIRAKA